MRARLGLGDAPRVADRKSPSLADGVECHKIVTREYWTGGRDYGSFNIVL